MHGPTSVCSKCWSHKPRLYIALLSVRPFDLFAIHSFQSDVNEASRNCSVSVPHTCATYALLMSSVCTTLGDVPPRSGLWRGDTDDIDSTSDGCMSLRTHVVVVQCVACHIIPPWLAMTRWMTFMDIHRRMRSHHVFETVCLHVHRTASRLNSCTFSSPHP